MKPWKEVTSTISNNKYHDDYTINEIMEYVRYAYCDKDAIYNCTNILESYKKEKSDWYKFIMVFIIGLCLWLLLNIF